VSEPAPQPDARELTRSVLQACTGTHGFALAGVCSVEPSAWGGEFAAWLAAGKHGSMDYLQNNIETRLDPARMLDGVRAAVVVGDLYATRADNEDAPLRNGEGRIARYARGRDYHKVIKKRLHALADSLAASHEGHTFRAAVDTAPVLERELAARAGIGWTGKHTLMIHPREGSYTLLGVLLTTLDLEPEATPMADHCGTCTRCIEACPTNAITPYSVDGSRCISYLTIEHRERIEPGLHEGIGAWLYGCDICQEVCPHNSLREEPGAGVYEAYTARRDRFDLLEILGWDEDARRDAFISSAMKRATLAMMKRNAVIVLGNQMRREPDAAVLDRLRAVAADENEPELVRGAARDVLED
jgi:epoxyqueuosine reductase